MTPIPYLSKVLYRADGANSNFVLTFPYIERAHVEVYVDAIKTPYTWLSEGAVTINPPPASGALVAIVRATPRNVRLVDFNDGSVLTEADLDIANIQLLYLMQEALDFTMDVIHYDPIADVFDAKGRRITNVGDPLTEQDVVTLNYYRTVVLPELKAEVRSYMDAFTGPLLAEFERYRGLFDDYVGRVEASMRRLEELSARAVEELRKATQTLHDELLALIAEARKLRNEAEEFRNKAHVSSGRAKESEDRAKYIADNMKEFKHVGEWRDGGRYKPQNVVERNGSSYVLLVGDGLAPPPDTRYWALLARRGNDYYLDVFDGGYADSIFQTELDCGGAIG